MEKYDFVKKSNNLCLALGFFDCLHLGHYAIIKKAQSVASECGYENAIFTFNGNACKAQGKQVYTIDERKEIYNACGVNQVIAYDFNE